MQKFLQLLMQWLPTILHLLGTLGVFAGANNMAVAGSAPGVPGWATWPLALAGGLSHAVGVTVSHRNTAVAKAQLPPPSVLGETTRDQLFRHLASELATGQDADKLTDLAALIKKFQ